MGYVDAHVHIWMSSEARYPLADGTKLEQMKPWSFTPEELFKHTRPAGVNRINLIQSIWYGHDNRYMLDMIARYRDTFVGTAVIDVFGPDPAGLMTKLAEKKVRAFRIMQFDSRQPVECWLQPEAYAKMFTAGAKNNQAISFLIEPDGLPEVERMCKAFPETPVIIDHLCRIGGDGVIRERDVDALCAMAQCPRVMVKVGAFYFLGKKQPPYGDLAPLIQRVVQAFGARRCMWESDCPYQLADARYTDSLDLIHRRLDFLTNEDRDWLLRRTAEAFFFKN
jgi:predicted TIM-barrel fold metal-dependent hydrolase